MDSPSKVAHSLVRVLVGTVVLMLTASLGLVSSTGGTAGASTKLRKPGPPTDLTLVEVGNTDSITISWAPPISDGGSPITGYLVDNQHGVGGPGSPYYQCTVVTGPTSCTKAIPSGKTKNRIIVRAVNAVGAGKPARAGLTTIDRPNCTYFGPNADLQYCNLPGAVMSGIDLSGDLAHADLSGADLSGDTLSANMDDDNLSGANLSGAHGSVQMGGAILTNADLVGANLTGTLTGANLTGADLTGATINMFANGANFTGANMTNANLTGSFLYVGSGPPVPGPNTAILTNVVWSNTTCPDGTNSDADGGTCDNNLIGFVVPGS